MVVDLRKFLLRFAEEARENLQSLNDGLARLELSVQDSTAIHALFRAAHTIKGSSRLLKLSTITETAHQLEEVIAALRDQRLVFTPALGQLLYRAVDTLAAQIDRLAETGNAASLPLPDALLCRELAQAARGETLDAPPPAPAAEPLALSTAPQHDDTPHLKAADTVRIRLNKLDQLIKLMGEVVSSHARLRQRLSEVRELERAWLGKLSDAEQSSLSHFARELKEDVQAQEGLMSELHDRTLIMRMLPLTIVFEPAARMVRELGRSIGKQVECQVSGSEIELDRQVIDKLADPIVHLIRNAIDHGLESPEKRLAAGKPAQGHLRLSAQQDGDSVVIEITDDGAGIPLPAIREKAVRKGLVSAEEAAALSDREVIDLIFLPGFSTSNIITDLSGRGVGMDVVKQAILNELHGEVSVDTQAGVGTTFRLRLPLSIAVMRILLVEVDGLAFGFTAQHVAELLHLPESELLVAADRHAIRLRDEFIPVAPLAPLLGIPERLARRNVQRPQRGMLLVVLRVRNERFAVRVDQLLDERDMVLKPLPEHMRRLNLVAGMVITGKNELVNVLHAPALLDMARQAEAAGIALETAEQLGAHVLVVDDSRNAREIEKEVLEAHGYRVTLACDGLEAMEAALRQKFDAVLTDIDMPGLDGFALTEYLRQMESYRTCPIIILTGRESHDDKQRGIAAGADAYIVKHDFDQNNLVNSLRALLA